MKKILFAIAIVLTICLTANAQGRDGFFSNWNNGYDNRTGDDRPTVLGGELGGLQGNQDAPLGSGLLILTALGAGYAISRKRE